MKINKGNNKGERNDGLDTENDAEKLISDVVKRAEKKLRAKIR